MHLASMPWAPRRSIGAYAAIAAVVLGGIGAIFSLAGVGDPAAGLLTLAFLAVAPGAAVSNLVGGDRTARIAAAVAGTVAINGVVAETMLVLGVWSPRGGVLAVAAISALCVAARRFTGSNTSTGTEV